MNDNDHVRERPIGEAGRYILQRLADRAGVWHRGCGWRWDTESWTVTVLDRLANDGYVIPTRIEGKADAYKLTDKGKRKAKELLVRVPRQSR